MEDCTYTAEVMWDGAGEGARIFEFSAVNGDAMRLTPAANGKMVFAINKGGLVESVSGPALRKGEWATVQVMFEGNTASLYHNGRLVGKNTRMNLRPDSIRATKCYLGRGEKGGFYGGLIGRFTVHSVALVDQAPPVPDPAVFEAPPMFVSPDSLVLSAQSGSDPLGVVEYWFDEQGGGWNSGWTKETKVYLDNRNSAWPMRYRVRMRDKNRNETRFSQPVLAAGFPKGSNVLVVGPEAPAVIEAENHFAAVPSRSGDAAWEKSNAPAGFVGTGYMAVPDRGRVNSPFSDSAARLDYALNFTKVGRYFVWFRANGNNDGGASIHAGLGLKSDTWGTDLRTGSGRYAWTRSPAFKVRKAGNHLFSIWMREDGAMIDRLIFVADQGYEPSPERRAPDQVMIGEGPPESPLQIAR